MALLILLGILHSSLVAGNGLVGSHSLLRAYSALRDLHELHDKQSATTTTMQVPLLALLGVQSSGKTSMVDSIVGWPVGYTSRGTATRCPVRYILRGSPNRTYSVAGRPVLDRSGLRAAVQAHMEALAKSAGFTSKAGPRASGFTKWIHINSYYGFIKKHSEHFQWQEGVLYHGCRLVIHIGADRLVIALSMV